MPGESASYAAADDSHRVSPPSRGRSLGQRMVDQGGVRDQEQSLCHSALSRGRFGSWLMTQSDEDGSGE